MTNAIAERVSGAVQELTVEVHGHEFEITPAMRASIEGRLTSQLDGAGHDVQRVTVRLQPSPSGAADRLAQCSILLNFRPSGGLQVRQAAPAAAEAVSRAVDEARRALGRRAAAGQRHMRAAYLHME